VSDVLHFCSWPPCSQVIFEEEPRVLTEDGWMHPRCADEALEARG
jgi:hypothetical protein